MKAVFEYHAFRVFLEDKSTAYVAEAQVCEEDGSEAVYVYGEYTDYRHSYCVSDKSIISPKPPEISDVEEQELMARLEDARIQIANSAVEKQQRLLQNAIADILPPREEPTILEHYNSIREAMDSEYYPVFRILDRALQNIRIPLDRLPGRARR